MFLAYLLIICSESIHKAVNQRLKYVTQVQQQRPESSAVTLTWHACKYKVHKLHQRYMFTYLYSKQKDSIPLHRLSSLFKGCGLWTLSCTLFPTLFNKMAVIAAHLNAGVILSPLILGSRSPPVPLRQLR